MGHTVADIDLTPPAPDDGERLQVWMIENYARLRALLEDSYTATCQVGDYTLVYEFGVLKSRTLTPVFTTDFSSDFV